MSTNRTTRLEGLALLCVLFLVTFMFGIATSRVERGAETGEHCGCPASKESCTVNAPKDCINCCATMPCPTPTGKSCCGRKP